MALTSLWGGCFRRVFRMSKACVTCFIQLFQAFRQRVPGILLLYIIEKE
jgi:hypothetical protein